MRRCTAHGAMHRYGRGGSIGIHATVTMHCEQAQELSDDSEMALQWQELVQPWRATLPPQIYMAKGCEHCRHTGYQGRIGLYEIMPLSNELKKLVAADVNLDSLKQQAYREGVQPLRLSGAKRISEGLTTIEEVMRVVPL